MARFPRALSPRVSSRFSRARLRLHGPPMKFVCLSTTSHRGSDLHQSYQLWLCCVLRLSQPLDAFFRPYPSSLVSCRYRPGFRLQSISLNDSLVCLSTPSAPLAFLRPHPQVCPPRLQGLLHSLRPYRLDQCYPVSSGRSSPDFCPSEVSLARSRLSLESLLSWAFTRP